MKRTTSPSPPSLHGNHTFPVISSFSAFNKLAIFLFRPHQFAAGAHDGTGLHVFDLEMTEQNPQERDGAEFPELEIVGRIGGLAEKVVDLHHLPEELISQTPKISSTAAAFFLQ